MLGAVIGGQVRPLLLPLPPPAPPPISFDYYYYTVQAANVLMQATIFAWKKNYLNTLYKPIRIILMTNIAHSENATYSMKTTNRQKNTFTVNYLRNVP